ncbi:hypothetical protein [Polaribacter uvawellassae]|uniref:hypothetical protein n=1 Tax=Polaribacter uvawellassae TaxID=3133495 RepID=UPI00321BEE9D
MIFVLSISVGYSQQKDTVLYIPKTKYQNNKLLTAKIDSINLLKRRAVLTAKNSRDLTKRIAVLDSILNFYKRSSEDVINSLAKQTPVKIAENTNKNQQNNDTIIKPKMSNADKRLARLNAIIKRNDSLKLVKANKAATRIAQRKKDSIKLVENKIKNKLRLDSIKIAKATSKVKNAKDSILIAEKFNAIKKRNDSIKVALVNSVIKRKQDSIIVANNLRRAQLRRDSIKIANANIAAQKSQDSLNKLKTIRIAQLRQDSIRIANANIVAQRKRDSVKQVEAYRIAQFKQDSIRIANANVLAKKRRDSLNRIDAARRIKLRQDSIKIAQANISAQLKLDSIKQVESIRKAQYIQDSIRIAKANFNAKRRSDSIVLADINRKVKFIQDSIRIAKANIAAKIKREALNNAIALQTEAKRKQDSIKSSLTRLNVADLTKRKQDSINNIINSILTKQRAQDSIIVAEAKTFKEQETKRIQDSIINSVAKAKIDDIFKDKDSTNVATNNFNTNQNLVLNDSIDDRNFTHSDLVNAPKFLDTLPYLRTGNILSKFVRNEIDLNDGQIVSNVLKVINIGSKPVTFTTDLMIPGGWTRIDDENKKYVAKQNDTTIVPIIISPTKLVNGNTEIIVNSFIVDIDQRQLANNYFSLKTKKKVGWDIELTDTKSIYLKNGEKSKRFKFQLHNSGNYKQDLFVNYSIPKKDLFLSDTLGNAIEQPNVTFSLEAREKKLFDYIITFKDMNKRNFKRISYNSYSPNKEEEKKTHSLIINSREPRANKFSLQKRTKVDFIKLPNEIKANPYGYPYLPLTVIMSAQNILSDRSFLALNLRGFKQLSPTANLIYSTDLSYSNSYYTKNILSDAPWYVGYFDDKKTLEIGQVSGNITGVSSSGYGVKGSYRFNDTHEVGAFYVNSNGFAATNSSISFGVWHNFNYNENIRVKTQLGRNINSISNRSINVLSIQPSIRISNNHNISVLSSVTNKKMDNEPVFFNPNGLLVGVSYSSSFLNKRLKYNFNTRFNDKNFSFGNFSRMYLNQRTNYIISNKWSVFLTNNYQQSANYNAITGNENYSQKSFYNNLIFNTGGETGNYQAGLFYEYRNFPNSIIHNRGLTFRFSNYDFEKQFINSIYLKAGYTKPELNNVDNKDYFNFELSSLTRYRTWNFNAKYNLGAFSSLTSQQALNDFITPQSVRVSAQNQYLFPNRKLVIESNVIYSYNNVFNNHTLGVYPTVYFFNNTGWRFGVSTNYTFTTRDFSSVYDPIDNQAGDQFNPANQVSSSNFNLNFNLKKDFGIPIPFVDRTAANAKFISFLDVNGNGIRDNDETLLQNVVVKIDKKEVLTDVNGEAMMQNLLKDEYDFDAFSLENLNGWFPNINSTVIIENDDIVYVPFVRGVKVYGDVVLDRQKIAVTDDAPLDLSRIKISATVGEKVYGALTNNKGRFEFYLPFGDYVITMDESILNNRLQITRNNIPLKLKSTQDGVYVSFYIIEKRRKVIFTDFTKKKN